MMKHIKIFEKFDAIYYLKDNIYAELYQLGIYSKLRKSYDSITKSDINRINAELSKIISFNEYNVYTDEYSYKLTCKNSETFYQITKLLDNYWTIMSSAYIGDDEDDIYYDIEDEDNFDVRFFICDCIDGVRECIKELF